MKGDRLVRSVETWIFKNKEFPVATFYLHFGQLVSHLRPLALALREFELQLLDLSFGLLPAMLGLSFALHQRLHLDAQLVLLGLQGLFGLLHRHFVLQGQT